MKLIKTINSARRELRKYRASGRTIGFVPTMGALHEGHLSLVRQAAKDNDIVVVSIFVNPAQFGPKEDLKKYPRTIKEDLAYCRKLGVDIVFAPSVKEIYPHGFLTSVFVKDLSSLLCGLSRSGHFQGVTTVVAKLLNIIQPDTLYLGQKDAQQVIIIKRMVADLNMPVKIKVMPTVRQANGLALSSRNKYLNKRQIQDASVLSRALNLAKVLIKNGARDTLRIISRMKQLILQKNAKVDYIAIVDAKTLSPLKFASGDCLIALAVRIGKTRLIDNISLRVT